MQNLIQSKILNTEIFTELVSKEFTKANPEKYRFLNRTAFVNVLENEIAPKFVPAVPKIKLGARVGDGMVRRITKNDKTENDKELLEGWRKLLAERIADGLKTRMNIQACEAQLESRTVHVEHPWNLPTATPIRDVRNFVKATGRKYNRITVAGTTLKLVFDGPEFRNARAEYGALFDESVRNLSFGENVQLFAKLTKVFVEVDDTTYWQAEETGARRRYRVLPENKIIFSCTHDDNNPEIADFALTIVSSAFESYAPQAYEGPDRDSPVAYFKITSFSDEEKEAQLAMLHLRILEEENVENLVFLEEERKLIEAKTEEIIAWGVAQGAPRKHSGDYTACLEVL